tara:strand:- start:229 stop:951 length:723 start_codon:yes stop_codon:yes gene_type:complete
MRLREITSVRENPLAAVKTGAQKAAGAVKQAAGAVKQAVAPNTQKVGQGAKMAANKMGGKGTGGMMAKGLDKLASGGALTGNLSKQIAPFAKQLSTILADTTLRNKFMMLVKQAEAGAQKQAQAQPQMQTQSIEEGKKASCGCDPNGDCCGDKHTAEEIGKKCKCCGNEIKAVKNEAATPGATSAGAIATVANPITAYAKVKKDGKGVPKADQKKTPKGTAVNALDMKGASLFGGTIQKR